MNYIYYFIYSTLIITLFAFSSCGNKENKSNEKNKQEKVAQDTSEALKLAEYLVEMGDYVNSRNFPSLIKASSVYEELDGNTHIIDMRHPDVYKKGHIKNAINVRFSDLPSHFENEIVPFEFDKIILVCYGGQIASYSTSLLRLMGYGNVYSMRWGMSAWDKKFAEDYWLSGVSSKYQDKLENEPDDKAAPGKLPELNTGLNSGEEIHSARISKLFEQGLKNVFISADEVFEKPKEFNEISNVIKKLTEALNFVEKDSARTTNCLVEAIKELSEMRSSYETAQRMDKNS